MTKLDNLEKQQLEIIILEFIKQSYETWRQRKVGHEPCITVTLTLDYLLQHGACPKNLKFAVRRKQQSMVRSLLTGLLNRGKLTSSIGLGERGGEARCYELA